MAVNKVIFGGETLIDTSVVTVTAEQLAKGITALDKTGALITGLMEAEGTNPGIALPPNTVVRFYDYEGTLLHAYTAAEAKALTGLPELPTRPGLICQGWNWSLDSIQSYVEKYPHAIVIVGSIYITDDGKTRLYIRISTKTESAVNLNFNQYTLNGVEVDWGDGTPVETFGVNAVTTTHQYTEIGEYVIRMTPIGTSKFTLGSGVIGGGNANNSLINTTVRKVEIGANASCELPYCFYGFSAMEAITIPEGSVLYASRVFQGAGGFDFIALPKSATEVLSHFFEGIKRNVVVSLPETFSKAGSDMFANTHISAITIPDATAIIGAWWFSRSALTSITLPDSVTAIGEYAFTACKRLRELHLASTVPPTMKSLNALENVSAELVIYVPVGSLNAYQTATNWSTYAAQMREEDPV